MSPQALRLNLGCGPDRKEGFVNVDIDPSLHPDLVWDLNNIPYPFDDNSVDYVSATQIYEHLYLHSIHFFQEIYRILKPDGVIEMMYPNMFSLANRFRFLFGRIEESREWNPHHLKLVHPQYIIALLRHVGFQPQLCYVRLPWLPYRYLFSRTMWLKARKRR